jgi:ubiquinone/menaquinone biosynthesis C-methylase UbiE
MSWREHPLCGPAESWPGAYWGPEPLDSAAWRAFAERLDVDEEAAILAKYLDGASTLLDVGGGLGTITRQLTGIRTRRVLLDPVFVSGAGSDILANDGTRIHVVAGRAEQLPFAASTFDAVLATWVLQYTSDPLLAVAEMARVATSAGTVSIVQAHPDNFLVRCYNECARIAHLPPAHHGFLLASAAEVLEATGFNVATLRALPATLRVDPHDTGDTEKLVETIVNLHFTVSDHRSQMHAAVGELVRTQLLRGTLHDDGVLLVARRRGSPISPG